MSASTRLAWQRELRRLLAFSDVSLPGAITDGAAFRWRNHVLSSVSLTTAQRRLSLIHAFYADALRSALVEHNPFASLPLLQASSLPPRPLNPEQLQQLDHERRSDPIYGLVRWLGLRPREAAELRPMDWTSIDGNPVLQISSGRLAQQRCLPIPEQLMPLWQQCSGSGEAPLWADSTARRRSCWPGVGLMGCGAPAFAMQQICARSALASGVSRVFQRRRCVSGWGLASGRGCCTAQRKPHSRPSAPDNRRWPW